MTGEDAGTRYIVSLGRDEVAQLAVAGSLCLAARRFIAMPEPEFITEPELSYVADVYAAPGWTTSLRSPSQVTDK